jgi:hypothetical protein
MRQALEEALARCLARMEEGAAIEECLRDHAGLAAELRPLLEAAQTLRGPAGGIPEHTSPAFERGRARMHAARREAEGERRAPFAGLFGRPLSLVAVAAVVALLAALGFTTDLFRFGADTTSAHVQGVVSRVDADAIVITTPDGQVVIRIGENTVVLDASGNPINGGDIVPGRSAKIEVEEDDDGEFDAQRIEVEDDEDDEGGGAEVEFSGVVDSVSGVTIAVQASFGPATVTTDSETEIRGTLAEGATVEIHATLQDDGSYLAREIEAQAAVGDGDDNSGPGGDNSGSGSGSDDEPDGN